MVCRAAALRALLLLGAAGRARGAGAAAEVSLSSIDAEDPLADEVLCPMSLIQTTLRQVRLHDGAEEDLGPPPAAAAAGGGGGAPGAPAGRGEVPLRDGVEEIRQPPIAAAAGQGGSAPGVPAVGRGEATEVSQPAGSSPSAELLPSMQDGTQMDVHSPALGSESRGASSYHWASHPAPTSAAAVQPAVLHEVEHHSGGNHSASNRSTEFANPDHGTRAPVAGPVLQHLGLAAKGHVTSRSAESAATWAAAAAQAAAERLTGAGRGGGLRATRSPRWAAWRDARVIIMLFVLVLLLAITTVMSVRSVFVGMRRRGEGSARERAVKAIPLCGIQEVEQELPSTGGYDCALARPLSAGRPLRFEARIVGPLAGGTTLVAPLTQRPCVLYEASVARPAGAAGRAETVARCSRSVDFAVELLGAPEVQVELHGEEVSLFGMCDGLSLERRPLASAPEHWATFAAAHRLPSAEEAAEEEVLDFREAALLVGSLVTLVGDLHRGVTGVLSLWPWHAEAGEVKPKDTPDAEEGRRVLEPWRTSWERSVSRSAEEAEEDEELHFGTVLASDDPALLAGHEHRCCGLWCRLRERARRVLLAPARVQGPGGPPGVDGPQSGP